jgi:ribosomal protein S18 acetylase RimI-like enzyme
MEAFETRIILEADRNWIAGVLKEHWGSTSIVSRGRVHRADGLPGFAAVRKDEPIGLATYRIERGQCELLTLNSFAERMGVGSALVNRVKSVASEAGCTRLWLVTTNDNTPALRFYQKRGFRLAAVHVNALKESRRLKPEIPEFGIDGLPLRDEIELDMAL